MPVPGPDSYPHSQAEMYQLLLQMNRKLDKLAAAVQKTNSVLQTWPAMINQGTVKLEQDTQSQSNGSIKPGESSGTQTQGAKQKQGHAGGPPAGAPQGTGSTAKGGEPNAPHGSEEPVMVTTPQGVTIVRF